MEVEGICTGQGCLQKSSRLRSDSLCAPVIAALMIIVFANTGQAKPFDNEKHHQVETYKSVECEDISGEIIQLVCELGYSDKVAKDLVSMVSRWKSKKGIAYLTSRREKLQEAREACKQNKVKIYDVAKIEANTASDVSWMIENELYYDERFFEIPDIIEHKQANCVGFAQFFYIIGSCVGLNVKPINVIEYQNTDTTEADAGHIACIVELSNGRLIMINPVPNGSISDFFIMEDEYKKEGNYWQLKNINNRLNLYRSIQLLDENGLTSQIHNSRACLYLNSGQLDKAITEYTKAIELNPDYAEAYSNRGISYYKSGQTDNALFDYNKAIELNPKNAVAYINRGITYRSSGKLDLSIKDNNHAIKLNSRSAEAFNNRGIAYHHLGQIDKAIQDYSKALKLNSKLAQAYHNRGIAYGLSGEYKRAISDFNSAIKTNPNPAGFYYSRAIACGKLEKINQAIADYTKAIKHNPEFTNAYKNRAISYALSGKHELAKKDLLKIIELEPDLQENVAAISERFQLSLNVN